MANELKNRYLIVTFPTHRDTDGKDVNHFLACSGATGRTPDTNVWQKEYFKWFQGQVDYVEAHLSDRPTLITFTIGANDFDFVSMGFLIHMYVDDENTFVKWVDKLIYNPNSGVKALLQKQLERLLAHENLSIVMAEVINPYNPTSFWFASPSFNSCGLSYEACFRRATYAVSVLNGAYSSIRIDLGNPERLQIAAVQSKFQGHKSPLLACGGTSIAETYVQYPGDPNSNSLPASLPLMPGWLVKRLPAQIGGDCFHPNSLGASVYAKAVGLSAINAGK